MPARVGRTHIWSMQKVNGAYADPSMQLVIFPSAADASEVDVNKAAAEGLMGSAGCTVVEAGESMTPASGGSCFELHVFEIESQWRCERWRCERWLCERWRCE